MVGIPWSSILRGRTRRGRSQTDQPGYFTLSSGADRIFWTQHRR
jgi:hypothetical protein